MGIYIKGMEMPKETPVIIQVYPEGTVRRLNGSIYKSHFEAVSVPPHGRLIDSDELTKEMRLFIKENMLLRDDARELIETIADAPTIIPAEEREK